MARADWFVFALFLSQISATSYAQDRFFNRHRIDDLAVRTESLEQVAESLIGHLEQLNSRLRTCDDQATAGIAELKLKLEELRAKPSPKPEEGFLPRTNGAVRSEISTVWNNPRARELGVFVAPSGTRLRLTLSEDVLLVRHAGGQEFKDVVGKLWPASPGLYHGRIWAVPIDSSVGEPLKHNITITLNDERNARVLTQLDLDGARAPPGYESVRTFVLKRR